MENRWIYHNSQNSKFRHPFGAVRVNTIVELSLEIKGSPEKVLLVLKNFKDEEEIIVMDEVISENGTNKYIGKVHLQDKGIYSYHFVINTEVSQLFYGNNSDGLGGEGAIYDYDPKDFQITVYEGGEVPDWLKDGVMYQIFVDRFFNGEDRILNPKKNSFIYGNWNDRPMYVREENGDIARWDFFGGNLRGVIKKLDYLRDMGINIIYLNPIFKATSNHKYDTGNYKEIDEMFGDEETFKELCEEGKARGIKIILDGVFSHTGRDSIYFNMFNKEKSIGAYQSKDSMYYSWYRFTSYPDEYESWWGIKDLPNVDELNPGYLEYIIRSEDSVISKWMDLGVAGWRLDVADELPDEFIKILRKKVKGKNNDGIIIGEVWEDASNKSSYGAKREYFFGEELDSVTNYPLRDSILAFLKGHMGSRYFGRRILSLKENYPKENFYSLMNLIGNHDTERALTYLGNLELLKLAVVIQMTMVGVPLIYYGDEAGVEGGKDPDNRRTFPWGEENKDILYTYKKAIAIRKNNKIFINGDIDFILSDESVLVFKRTLQEQVIYVCVNRDMNNEKEIILPLEKGRLTKKDLLTDEGRMISDSKLTLAPLEAVILK